LSAERLWDNIDGFSSTTVEQLLQLENRHSSPRYPIPAGYSLFHAFELLARSGFERVCITNAEGQIASIISQSMLIDYMHENVAQLGSVLRNRRIADFVGLHPGAPCRVKTTDKVVTGFQKMSRWNVSGLGVVDLNGKLVDVLTERDLRGNKLDAISFWGLYSTVASFKESVRQTYGEVPNRLITVKQTDTLEKALFEMSTNKIRQLFMVDANNVPMKMISQKDLLFQVLNQKIEG
jgi:CBS domain-containing protein